MTSIAYRKSYKIRIVGTGGIEVSLPRVVVERAARKHGLEVKEFVEKFKLVHLYNNFTGIDGAYRFEPVSEEFKVPKIK